MVSIVIRTYNEQKHLEELLTAIKSQNYTDYEIIIVDSGSTDKTLEIAKNFKCKIVNIKKEDFSFGYSLNKGIAAAKGDFCVFVSGHCIPINYDWLDNLIKPFEDENVAISYGRQIGVESSKFSEHMIFNSWFPEESVKKQLTSFCNNANSALRKSVWKKIAKYDEKVSGLEDLVLAEYLLKTTPYYLSYVADSVIYHIHDETYSQIRHRYEREAVTFSSIFYNEKFTFFHFLELTSRNIFSDLRSLWKSNAFKFRLNNIVSIFRFRYNQFLGTRKGYKINKRNKVLRKRFYYPN
jgi:rhamnosyltransferase